MSAMQPNNTQADPGRSPNALPETEANAKPPDATIPMSSNMHLQSQRRGPKSIDFAGLFSAVVTAFVIESYKFLQPSPDDAAIHNHALLPDIVRYPAQCLFFLSLILSLTTVLIGTVSLQWLREHQSYPNFSPKKKQQYSTCDLKPWRRAGLIDFALPLGLKLIIPVSVVVGLTLLFLGATTVLPASQGLFFFFATLINMFQHHVHSSLPSPMSSASYREFFCAYSPPSFPYVTFQRF
ncbi:hypothetical protein BJ912DRAFT_1059357 [Pholiota molesta]|nr:hypothetical protein BJ912DRAFT_1059357 [Pholiota molesta]